MEKKIIINIGRQFGSGGKDIAAALGRKLNIPVYDGELIDKAAQDTGFSAELFKKSDEKKSFSFSALFSGTFIGGTEEYMSGSGLFKMQSETILKIAEQGSAVIVGRCSDYILRNHENALNVFITAPLEDRMKRTCERGEATPENVEHFVNKKDKGREEYYNYYSFGNWGMAAGYDICINSSVLGIEGSADLIIEFARRSGLL